ncbi:MAG: tetraacyldisaccharide 4'-kinase [Pirellulales bacterium]|nr:tetraacyldisaccharide 4'-kinase [Pirellulales bacterium]
MSPSEFRDLVSGRRGGAVAGLARMGLRLVEFPYTAVVRYRNGRYDSGRAEVHKAAVPVVSVGNLSLGGTGKTPMVQWLARRFHESGRRVVVVSRGYGAKHEGGANDEALELERKLPGVDHLENPDRVAAVGEAVERFGAQVAILDDAFQHRRIGRDLDIVLLDALEPFGFEHVFPRGTLREPVEELRRAHVVALSRAELLNGERREKIRRRVRQLAPDALWVEVSHTADTLENATGERMELDSLAGRSVAAFCGLGNPAGFRHTLESCGYRAVAMREFPDHYSYSPADVALLSAWADELAAQEPGVEAVICTSKDLVKLGVDCLGRLPLWALSISLTFLHGRAEFEQKLEALLM